MLPVGTAAKDQKTQMQSSTKVQHLRGSALAVVFRTAFSAARAKTRSMCSREIADIILENRFGG